MCSDFLNSWICGCFQMSPSLGIPWSFSGKDSTFPAEGPGSIPGQGSKISQATGHGQKTREKQNSQYKMAPSLIIQKRERGVIEGDWGQQMVSFLWKPLRPVVCAVMMTAHLSVCTSAVRSSSPSAHRSLALREQGPCRFPALAPRDHSSHTGMASCCWAEGTGKWVPASAHAKR